MAGDPTQARLWADADVYVAFGEDQAALDAITRPSAFTPADPGSDWSADWDLIGLLDGDEGFTEAREQDDTDHYAWGGIIYRSSHKNFKVTRRFVAVEVENPTVDRLRWPGSTDSSIVVPTTQIERVLVGFEKREGSIIRRLITAHYAEVMVDGDVEENETDPSKVAFIATVFPDPSTTPATLFTRSTNAETSS